MLIKHSKWEQMQKEAVQKAHEPFQTAVNDGTGKGYDFNGFSQDLYSSLYQVNPKFPEQASAGTAWAKKALDELKSLPEFNQLREMGTKCDSFQSGLGATILTKRFAESLPKVPEKNPDEIQKNMENLQDLLEDVPQTSSKRAAFEGRLKSLEQSKDAATDAWEKVTAELDPAALRQTLRRALMEAGEEISEANEQVNAFGFGNQPGQDGYTSTEQKMEVAETIRNSPKLQKIAELAGRFRREAQKKQANKKQPGPDELTDIETGNDLGRVIPAELMELGNSMTKKDFFRKYLERSLIQYKLEEHPKEDKGPMVICLDNSGSMAGDNEVWSKAIALALAQISVQQKRAFAIVHFDTGVCRVDSFVVGKIDPAKLLESCAFFSAGGTDFDNPLNEAFDMIQNAKNLKKADVIFITDGICNLKEKQRILKNKQEAQANIYSICLGGDAEELREISDSYTNLVDLTQDAEIKDKLFSI